MGAISGAIAGGLAAGLASGAVGALAGGGKGVSIPMGGGVAPGVGLQTSSGMHLIHDYGRNFSFNTSPAAYAAVQDIKQAGRGAAAGIDDLLGKVSPGFGALTDARVRAIQDARSSSVSNLRDNLARRRVLGSSFGQDTVSRADAEFAKAEGEARAQSLLEEIDLTSRLINERTNYLISAAEKEIGQINMEFTMASNLINGTQQVLQSNAGAIANLAAANAAGTGAFANRIANPLANALGSWVSSQFAGGGAGGGGYADAGSLAGTSFVSDGAGGFAPVI